MVFKSKQESPSGLFCFGNIWYNVFMSTVVGQLHKKSILRDMQGNIRRWIDETNGGIIVDNYQIVNQEKWNEYVKKEEDRKLAAQAQVHAVAPPPERPTAAGTKILDLEKRIDAQDKKLDAILAALKK